jgi:hypothetical protein
MKFKEFWKISTKSEEPDLKDVLDRHIKNNSTKYEQLIEESTSLDTQRRLIQVLKKTLGELDPEQDQQSIFDLEYIIRLYTEWADLNQEILVNLKTVNRSEIEAIESMQLRINEIQKETVEVFQDLEKRSPKILERFFAIAGESPKENRTN